MNKVVWAPALLLVLGGCVTTQPVDHPCGVITDSLQNVNATTRAGNERLAIHMERGVRAGCWKRVGHLPVLADPVVVAPTERVGRGIVVIAPPGPVTMPEPSLIAAAIMVTKPPKHHFFRSVLQHLHSGIKW